MRKPDITDAILSLRPGYVWNLIGEEYEGLEWLSPNGKPTKAEVIEELNRLNEEYDSLEYQRLRKEEYLPLEEQLDMIYWDRINGTNNWINHIQTVKTNNPKP